MADIIASLGYASVAPGVREVSSRPIDALYDHIFNILGISGGIAGAAISTMIDIGYPVSAGLLCTVLGSCTATFGCFLGHSLWQTTHHKHA